MTKIALITGASRGLGAALAEALAPSHHIIAVARTVGALEEVDDRVQAKGGAMTIAPLDITQADAMQHLCKSIFDRWGGIDLWAHTAIHAAPLAPAQFVDAKDWQKSMDINVTATQRMITYVHSLLEPRAGAQAVFFDDAKAGDKFFGAYGATKAAQIAIAHSWQAETVNTGPIVQIVTPDAMPTATRARFYPGEDRSGLSDISDVAHRIVAELQTPV
jgi:NAD(P)-dependent dehydrogenase (short-subunit alcohol dehydrogenase family)